LYSAAGIDAYDLVFAARGFFDSNDERGHYLRRRLDTFALSRFHRDEPL
jgi:hypothetical protein